MTTRSAAARRLELALDGVASIPEAATFLGLCRAELYLMMGRGELAFAKFGRRRVIPRRALVELLASRMSNGED